MERHSSVKLYLHQKLEDTMLQLSMLSLSIKVQLKINNRRCTFKFKISSKIQCWKTVISFNSTITVAYY